MNNRNPPRARITVVIPLDRVDMTLGDGKSRPKVGDIVELDQGCTAATGEPAGIVICHNPDRSVRWVADVLESEMEAVK